MWVKEANCASIVDDVWSSGGDQSSIKNIMRLISRCGLSLTQWNIVKFGNIQQRLFKTNQALRRAQKIHPASYNSEEIT